MGFLIKTKFSSGNFSIKNQSDRDWEMALSGQCLSRKPEDSSEDEFSPQTHVKKEGGKSLGAMHFMHS